MCNSPAQHSVYIYSAKNNKTKKTQKKNIFFFLWTTINVRTMRDNLIVGQYYNYCLFLLEICSCTSPLDSLLLLTMPPMGMYGLAQTPSTEQFLAAWTPSVNIAGKLQRLLEMLPGKVQRLLHSRDIRWILSGNCQENHCPDL